MKTLASILIVFFSAAAVAGPTEGVGGGDPMAMEFLEITKRFRKFADEELYQYLSKHHLRAMTGASHKWHKSLNRNRRSLVIFVEDRPLDQFGVPKAATFNPKTGEVLIHRPTWSSMHQKAKLELVAMELMGIAGLKYHRYLLAMEVVREFGEKILGNLKRAPEKCQPND